MYSFCNRPVRHQSVLRTTEHCANIRGMFLGGVEISVITYIVHGERERGGGRGERRRGGEEERGKGGVIGGDGRSVQLLHLLRS